MGQTGKLRHQAAEEPQAHFHFQPAEDLPSSLRLTFGYQVAHSLQTLESGRSWLMAVVLIPQDPSIPSSQGSPRPPAVTKWLCGLGEGTPVSGCYTQPACSSRKMMARGWSQRAHKSLP